MNQLNALEEIYSLVANNERHIVHQADQVDVAAAIFLGSAVARVHQHGTDQYHHTRLGPKEGAEQRDDDENQGVRERSKTKTQDDTQSRDKYARHAKSVSACHIITTTTWQKEEELL